MKNCRNSKTENLATRTVDGNGNNLGQVEAVGTLESRDLAEGLDLAVLSAGVGNGIGLSLNQLNVQVVVLGSDQDGEGAPVLLKEG